MLHLQTCRYTNKLNNKNSIFKVYFKTLSYRNYTQVTHTRLCYSLIRYRRKGKVYSTQYGVKRNTQKSRLLKSFIVRLLKKCKANEKTKLFPNVNRKVILRVLFLKVLKKLKFLKIGSTSNEVHTTLDWLLVHIDLVSRFINNLSIGEKNNVLERNQYLNKMWYLKQKSN